MSLKSTLMIASLLMLPAYALADQAPSPYGKAKSNMHQYEKLNTVFDVNYENPEDLNTLYFFVRNTGRALGGDVVVVTHGPELRAFARENYVKYQGIMDRMAELAGEGVEFRMCNNAMKAAGYEAEDMHGFVTIVPAGFPEVASLQAQGYQYVNPLPLPVRDVRYLERPDLKKQ
jgi:intracellular sulfur oxidation DsrE/DsrF family protein